MGKIFLLIKKLLGYQTGFSKIMEKEKKLLSKNPGLSKKQEVLLLAGIIIISAIAGYLLADTIFMLLPLR